LPWLFFLQLFRILEPEVMRVFTSLLASSADDPETAKGGSVCDTNPCRAFSLSVLNVAVVNFVAVPPTAPPREYPCVGTLWSL
jgi:hypothetical protein